MLIPRRVVLLCTALLLLASGCDGAGAGAAALPGGGPTAGADGAAGAADVAPTVAATPGVSGLTCSPAGAVEVRLVVSEAATCDAPDGRPDDAVIGWIPRSKLSSSSFHDTTLTRCQAGVCADLPGRLTITRADSQRVAGRWSATGPDGAELGDAFEVSPCSWTPEPALIPTDAAVITDISLYQAVEIPLMRGGVEVQQLNAPVIAGRRAIVRASIVPRQGQVPGALVARLTLTADGLIEPFTLDLLKVPSSEPTQASWQSTFNFDVPAEWMKEGLGLSIALFTQADCPTPGAPGARYPEAGLLPLKAQPSGPVKLVIVPIRYDADGSGRLPDTSQARLDLYTSRLEAQYPATEFQITVRDEGGWNYDVLANGEGWGQLLAALAGLRYQDEPASDVYYYGLFDPTVSMAKFCGFGYCVAGLSNLPDPNEASGRVSIGLGFSESAAGTMVHELGHAHGRPHTPCGVDDAPPGFPYAGGGVGTWGYDLQLNTLISPDTTFDFMGYCDPTWVSDFTYRRLHDRIVYVNAAASLGGGGPAAARQAFRLLTVSPDGHATLAGTVQARGHGAPLSATALDAAGAPLAVVTVYERPLSHVDDRLLLVPATPPGAATLRLPDGRLVALTGLAQRRLTL
jgi:hypothetical protein